MKIMMLLLLILTTSNVFAHGENIPGPHGGHIRMPGAFHTELVLSSQSAKVYLIDARFKNPITENSKVDLTLHFKDKSEDISCVKEQDHFTCPLPKKLTTITGIDLKAVRNGVVGKVARYSLPLSFPQAQAPETSNNDHAHHNH